jgi:hypothetical protein
MPFSDKFLEKYTARTKAKYGDQIDHLTREDLIALIGLNDELMEEINNKVYALLGKIKSFEKRKTFDRIWV